MCDVINKFIAKGTRVEIGKLEEGFAPKVLVGIWKSRSTRYRHDNVAMRIICIKNVKFKIVNTKTGCQHVG